mgnify:CR=1 FL=1
MDLELFYGFLLIGIVVILPFLGQTIYKKYKELYIRNIAYEDRDERFEEICSNLNDEKIAKVEQVRKQIRKKKIFKNMAFIFVLTVCSIFNINYEELTKTMPIELYDLYKNAHIFCLSAIQFGIPLWVISTIIKSEKIQKYEKQYKNSILSTFVNLYDNNFLYKTEIEMKKRYQMQCEYVENKFWLNAAGGIDYIDVQNNISSRLKNNTMMNIYDIAVQKYEDGGTSEGEIFFKGTYIVLEFNKLVATFVRITENKFIARKNKVELDSSEFEKYFDVNSKDKILAVRILTADVMQLLVDFYKKYHLTFEIVFRDNKVYINLHTEGTFKIPIYKKINKKQLYLYYAILEFTTNLSKEINKVLNEIEL